MSITEVLRKFWGELNPFNRVLLILLILFIITFLILFVYIWKNTVSLNFLLFFLGYSLIFILYSIYTLYKLIK